MADIQAIVSECLKIEPGTTGIIRIPHETPIGITVWLKLALDEDLPGQFTVDSRVNDDVYVTRKSNE